MRFLADENIPGIAVQALQRSGVDISWVGAISPGVDDRKVMRLAQAEGRVLITFDKDFAELVFRESNRELAGVILLRIIPQSPQHVLDTLRALLQSERDWTGHFSVITDTRIRMVPLPRD